MADEKPNRDWLRRPRREIPLRLTVTDPYSDEGHMRGYARLKTITGQLHWYPANKLPNWPWTKVDEVVYVSLDEIARAGPRYEVVKKTPTGLVARDYRGWPVGIPIFFSNTVPQDVDIGDFLTPDPEGVNPAYPQFDAYIYAARPKNWPFLPYPHKHNAQCEQLAVDYMKAFNQANDLEELAWKRKTRLERVEGVRNRDDMASEEQWQLVNNIEKKLDKLSCDRGNELRTYHSMQEWPADTGFDPMSGKPVLSPPFRRMTEATKLSNRYAIPGKDIPRVRQASETTPTMDRLLQHLINIGAVPPTKTMWELNADPELRDVAYMLGEDIGKDFPEDEPGDLRQEYTMQQIRDLVRRGKILEAGRIQDDFIESWDTEGIMTPPDDAPMFDYTKPAPSVIKRVSEE